MSGTRSDELISSRAGRLYESAIICDNTVPWAGGVGDPALREALPSRMKEAGLTFVSLTLGSDETDSAAAIKTIAAELRYWEQRSKDFVLVKKAADIVQAKRERKLAIGFHFQGTRPVERNLDLVNLYYQLGIRHMLMAYNQKNFVGDGCHELNDGGLSRFGHALIKEMNRAGMWVDVAHTGYRTSMDAIAASSAPVICSHGNVAALHEHPRSYRDDQLKAIAESGGVFGLTGLGIFMGSNNDASPQRFIEHIDYVVQLIGPRHVGFGLDYVYDMPALQRFAAGFPEKFPKDGGYTTLGMQQLEHERLIEVTQRLVDRGYADADITAILGGNWLRLAETIWR